MIEELREVKREVIEEVNKLISRIVAMESEVDKVKKAQDELQPIQNEKADPASLKEIQDLSQELDSKIKNMQTEVM